jgi:uncharacterized C2H2 Zn-finger protein
MPYRDGQALCPRCGAPLHGDAERLQCVGCAGRFVAFVALTKLAPLFGLSPTSSPATALRCPRCGQAMRTLTVTDVMVDFCATHGVWFDTRELESLLAQR